jgi:cytochrome c-type biogenesis protein CcmF
VFGPLMTPVFLLAGIAPMFAWRETHLGRLLPRLRWVALGSLVLGVASTVLFWDLRDIKTWAGLSMAFWLAGSAGLSLWNRVRLRDSVWAGLRSQSASVYGMTLAHLGIAVFLTGVTLSGGYSEEQVVRLAPGESVLLADYDIVFKGVTEVQGPNYVAREGDFRVLRKGRETAELKPQKRIYQVQRNTMTEAAIDPGFTRDLYVALGEPLDQGAWTVRAYYKPFIRWIWLGGLLMMAGGVCAAADRRYRIASVARETVISGDLAERGA